MLPVLPSLQAKAQLSISVNGVFVTFDKIPDVLRRFCTPATFHHGDQVCDVSMVGSTVRLRYRGRNLVLMCKHQLGKGTSVRSPEQFFLPVLGANGRRIGVGASGSATLKMENEEHRSLEDIVLIEYADAPNGRDLRPMFLGVDLNAHLGNVPPSMVRAIFAIGYPTFCGDVDFALDEDGLPADYVFDARSVKLYLAPSGAALLDLENRRPMLQDPQADQEIIEPDGMSGAPVFFIWVDDRIQPHLGFAGFITDARPDRYMIYDAEMVKQVLDRYLTEHLRPGG